MRILLVNKFYFAKGGADTHVLALQRLLEDRGHTVIVFAMDHPQNRPSPYRRYFVSTVDFERVHWSWSGLRTVGRMFYSFEAARKIDQLLRDTKPDLVHIHNIYHQLSPSILPVIARHGVPIVQTLHDYSLISASYNLYAHHGLCEHGIGGRYWQYVTHRCVKRSVAASSVAALEMTILRRWRPYERYVHTFLSPSQFLINTYRRWGFRHRRMMYLPNFVTPVAKTTPTEKSYFLYLGRLSPEKGVTSLLEAAAGTSLSLRVVGTGPGEAALRRLAAERRLTNITFLGHRQPDEIPALLAGAKAVVVPSVWYENCPLVILEALAAGVPVIAARLGGIPELVRHARNGLLFTAGASDELRRCLTELDTTPDLANRLSQGALDSARDYTAESYERRLMDVYERARN